MGCDGFALGRVVVVGGVVFIIGDSGVDSVVQISKLEDGIEGSNLGRIDGSEVP